MATIAAKVFPDNRTSATIQDGETIVVTKQYRTQTVADNNVVELHVTALRAPSQNRRIRFS